MLCGFCHNPLLWVSATAICLRSPTVEAFKFSVLWTNIKRRYKNPVDTLKLKNAAAIVRTASKVYNHQQFTVLYRTQSILPANADTLLSSFQMGLVCFMLLSLNGWLSIARDERHWDGGEVTWKAVWAAHAAFPRCTTASCLPPGSPPTSPPQPQLLWLRAFFLPDRVGCCCCWNCHDHLKRLSLKQQALLLLKQGWGNHCKTQNKK